MLSVIICTHNPREDYLRRTLLALEQQTLPKDQWELLLVDNSSATPLASSVDLSWHPQFRHIRESKLGLTPARFRGILEARGELLVFVDDDNILAQNYLQNAKDIGQHHPWMGAFGGSILPEFEETPDPFLLPYVPELTLYKVEFAAWGHGSGLSCLHLCPAGAGMVIRKAVCMNYTSACDTEPLRNSLDRKGDSLMSAGDADMALFACKQGLAVGKFPMLELLHLIPKRRLQWDYILRMIEGKSTSAHILRYLWEGEFPEPAKSYTCTSDSLIGLYKSIRRREDPRERRLRNEKSRADHRGMLQANRILHQSIAP